ncbi:MAG: hypothetical protein ACKVPX_10060 [Myxococcaceae bacterium]
MFHPHDFDRTPEETQLGEVLNRISRRTVAKSGFYNAVTELDMDLAHLAHFELPRLVGDTSAKELASLTDAKVLGDVRWWYYGDSPERIVLEARHALRYVEAADLGPVIERYGERIAALNQLLHRLEALRAAHPRLASFQRAPFVVSESKSIPHAPFGESIEALRAGIVELEGDLQDLHLFMQAWPKPRPLIASKIRRRLAPRRTHENPPAVHCEQRIPR